MLTLLAICFYTAVAAGALALFGFLTGRFFQVDPRPDAVVYCTTEDGWRLGLSRHRPERPLEGAPPVLLCPDVGLSAGVFDLGPETSLARFLAEHGHDVWLLDPRGRGASERPRLWGRRRCRWSFDDYVEFDAPAALAAVARETGAEQVQWVGLGLGTMVGAAAAATVDLPAVRSLTGLSFAAQFERPGPLLSPGVSALVRRIWSPAAVRLLAPLLGRLSFPPFRALQQRDNIDGPIYRRALVNSIGPLPRAELRQIAAWLERDRFTAADDQVDYRKVWQTLDRPVLLVSGPRDPLCPLAMVRQSLEGLERSPRTRLVAADRRHGLSANYGRLDLLLGRNARRDIFPHLLAWLDRWSEAELPGGRPRPPQAGQRWDAAVAPDLAEDTDPGLARDPEPDLGRGEAAGTRAEAAAPQEGDALDLDRLFEPPPRGQGEATPRAPAPGRDAGDKGVRDGE